MIKSVARTFTWASPDYINNKMFFMDSKTIEGIEFWYNDVVEQNRELPK